MAFELNIKANCLTHLTQEIVDELVQNIDNSLGQVWAKANFHIEEKKLIICNGCLMEIINQIMDQRFNQIQAEKTETTNDNKEKHTVQ